MSMLRHRFSNEWEGGRGGGGVAPLNQKCVYYSEPRPGKLPEVRNMSQSFFKF